MPKYQGESEDSTASKKERLKIKMKKHLPFLKAPANLFKDVPQVRRGLKNPNFKKQPMRVPKNPLLHLKVPLRPEEKAEKERKLNEEYKKRAKRQDRIS